MSEEEIEENNGENKEMVKIDNGLKEYLIRYENISILKNLLEKISDSISYSLENNNNNFVESTKYFIGLKIGQILNLVNIAVEIITKGKYNNAKESIIIHMYRLVNIISKIYIILIKNMDFQTYEKIRDNLINEYNELNRIIMQYLDRA